MEFVVLSSPFVKSRGPGGGQVGAGALATSPVGAREPTGNVRRSERGDISGEAVPKGVGLCLSPSPAHRLAGS